MKYILFLITTFSIQLVLGSQVFNGSLTKKGHEYFFTPKSSELLYRIIPKTDDVSESLSRLVTGDFISGYGALDTINKKISIQSIDYVGLQKLLGPWIGPEGTIFFKDFSTMRFTPRFKSLDMESPLARYQKEFHYSISPKEGNEWALFMSDHLDTTFATVEFTKKKIIMKIFEAESGNIVLTLKLERP